MRLKRVLAGLGTLCRLFSFSLLVPFFGSLYWDDRGDMVTAGTLEIPTPAAVYLLVFAILFAFGLLLSRLARAELEEIREREGFAIVGFAWLLIGLFGSLPFLLTGVIGNPVSAYFETMSGLTTTGATALDPAAFDAVPRSMHLWRSTTQFVGGLGVIVLAVAVLARMTEAGHRLMSAETPGGTVTRLKPKLTQTAAALWRIYLGFALVLFLILLPLMHWTGRQLPWKEASYDALLTTFSTMSTGGFSPRADSILFYGSQYVTWVVTAFMVLAGVNFNLYWHLLHGRRQRFFADSEFRFYLTVFFGAALTITGLLIFAHRNFTDGFEHGFFQAASFLTSTGFTSTDHNAFPDSGRLVLFLLMFTGGCVGSTAGGLKIIRIVLLFRITRYELQRLLHPHAVSIVKLEGRLIPEDTIRRVVVFFFSYISLVLAGSFAYAFLGMDFLSAVSTSASLVGNVGPGFNATAYTFHDVSPLGQAVGIVLMWMGRLEIFTALVLFFPRTYRE